MRNNDITTLKCRNCDSLYFGTFGERPNSDAESDLLFCSRNCEFDFLKEQDKKDNRMEAKI